MKKLLTITTLLLLVIASYAQNLLHVHRGNNVIFEKSISAIDSIKFQGSNSIFNFENDYMVFPVLDIDSITFSDDTLLVANDIYIIWNGNNVNIINPLANDGVTITNNGAKVTVNVTSSLQDIVYHLSGTTSDGYLYMTPNKRFTLSLEGVNITNSEGPAIDVLVDKKTNIVLANNSTNYLNDGSGNSKKAALQSKSELIFNGSGTLTVNGNVRNGIHSDDYVEIISGNIVVASAVADGIHCDYFLMSGGTLNITANGDGIDGDEGHVNITDGTIVINSPTADSKSIKCDSTLSISGGNITINNSGNISKGLKSKSLISIKGGTLNITSSGTTVLESTTSGNNPSYCTAIACNGNIHISGGIITLTLPTSNGGGKGISCDSTLTITGGLINISTAGDGASYTVSGSTKDSYTSSCIKSDYVINITGGQITCTSSGKGGKGISCDGNITIGATGALDSLLILNVTTSGVQFSVSSSSGGGGWPGGGGGPGGGGDYANPKGIKSVGNLTINSGIVTVNCTQSSEGGECLESKNILSINGGQITATSNYDDGINASNRINITGGTIYAASNNNDGIDCNGQIHISGGFSIASAVRTPEEAFDCDNNTFAITGGTLIGTHVSGSMYSSPTASACTQHSLKYTCASNNDIQIIRSSDNAVILTFHVPTMSSSGGGGWPGGGGGSSNAVLTFSSPDFVQGSYTIKYGGTISGGTNFHNYYTGATYTGGSTKTFTVGTSYSITTVQ